MKVVEEEEEEDEFDMHWRIGGVVLAFIQRWRKWGTGEAVVGGKVCTFNRFAAATGQSRG
jgi:hypothetical protein